MSWCSHEIVESYADLVSTSFGDGDKRCCNHGVMMRSFSELTENIFEHQLYYIPLYNYWTQTCSCLSEGVWTWGCSDLYSTRPGSIIQEIIKLSNYHNTVCYYFIYTVYPIVGHNQWTYVCPTSEETRCKIFKCSSSRGRGCRADKSRSGVINN